MNNSIHSLQKRLLAVFVLITFIFGIIIIKLGTIQIFKSKWLQAKAASQWTRDLPLQAQRGIIYDTNKVALAVNYTTYDVYVRPSMVKDFSAVAAKLCEVLGTNYGEIYEKITTKKLSEILIRMQVPDEQSQKLIESNIAGIMLSENNTRYYPYGDLLTQILGLTTIDGVGQSGLEVYYNKYLTGIDGAVLQSSDGAGVKIENTLSEYIPSIAGLNLELTIDVSIQKFAEEALNQLMKDHNPKSATAVVMKSATGEIVAMSSKPSFDLNSPPRDNVTEMFDNLRSLAITDVYEPGSTFKVLTMAAALDTNAAKLIDTFYDPGYIMVDGEKIKCWKLTGHGSQTLTDGLCNSCNSVFVELALRLGKDRMYEYFNKFGLGDTLNIDFLGEASGIIMDKNSAKNVDVARMGFGHAIAVTPLQLITAVNSTINGGKLMQPYLVKNVTDSLGTTIYENSPTVLKNTISTDTSNKIKVMFEEVVKNYSGIYSFIPGYRVGGKTGTSQKYEDGRISGKFISSFVGALPADNPEYTVLIVADEPESGHFFGSIVATPYAKTIFEKIIDYKKIPPQNLEEDMKKMEETITLPSLIGMPLSQAIITLNNLGLQFEIMGEGAVIKNQTPPANTKVFKRAIVILET